MTLTEKERGIILEIQELIQIRNGFCTTEAKAEPQMKIDKSVAKLKMLICDREFGIIRE